jgi:hypothetical protein
MCSIAVGDMFVGVSFAAILVGVGYLRAHNLKNQLRVKLGGTPGVSEQEGITGGSELE